MKIRQKLTDAAFLFPGLLIFTVFMLIPLVLSLYFSFTNWNGINPDFKLVGLKNFKILMNDSSFLSSLAITGAMTALTTILVNVIGVIVAAAVNKPGRLYALARTVIFIPAILSPVVVSFIWAYMTQTNGGIINIILSLFSFAPVDLYSNSVSVTLMISFVISWAAFGFYTTVYIANLKSIPNDVYEAANIDGVTRIQGFFHITLPLLRPAIAINTITALIWGLKQYDFVKVMVPGYIQTVTVYAVERAFEYNMFGYSSAIVFILMLITVFVSVFQLKLSTRKEVEF